MPIKTFLLKRRDTAGKHGVLFFMHLLSLKFSFFIKCFFFQTSGKKTKPQLRILENIAIINVINCKGRR